ncbi:type IV pilus modification PilV family protein [Methylovorus glucosotrophus]|uniref:Type IV pilus modification protein PilV n=1 Tax=Methylovorus glucosotrophus (strain SIP3-4) TaxID=582744 RepID=C6XB63_METGS|nr:hypothetical protein [Methylovorus glucosotrophus]ACT51833.1 conserved hypothetical protein [Methylovorus glucosotrophus SIP3-4]
MLIPGNLPARPTQQGSILLEGLIAILIFSIGILAIVGLHASAIKTVADAQYRLEASLYAERIVSQMWADVPNISTYAYPNGTATALAPWLANIGTLPGVNVQGNVNAPTIIVAGSAANGWTVTVNIYWQAPGATAGEGRHNFRSVSYISSRDNQT